MRPGVISAVWGLGKSCRPLKRTRVLLLAVTRHFRAGLSHAAATRLTWVALIPSLFRDFIFHMYSSVPGFHMPLLRG
jgi:hypothetical protein